MKWSKFSDEPILALVSEGGASRNGAASAARTGAPSRPTTAGKAKYGGMELS